MSSISAATSSSVLAHAGPITRLGLFQQAPKQEVPKEMMKAALEYMKNNKNSFYSGAEFLTQKFGLTDNNIAWEAVEIAQEKLYPSNSVSSSAPPMAPSFAGTDMSKLAKVGIADLLNGINIYNFTLKERTPEKILAEQQGNWNRIFEGRLRNNGGDEQDAINFAEKISQLSIDQGGWSYRGDRSVLDKALGRLSSAFNIDYTKFVTEKEDGTIALNYDFLKDTDFGKAVGLAQNYGYLVDKAA